MNPRRHISGSFLGQHPVHVCCLLNPPWGQFLVQAFTVLLLAPGPLLKLIPGPCHCYTFKVGVSENFLHTWEVAFYALIMLTQTNVEPRSASKRVVPHTVNSRSTSFFFLWGGLWGVFDAFCCLLCFWCCCCDVVVMLLWFSVWPLAFSLLLSLASATPLI